LSIPSAFPLLLVVFIAYLITGYIDLVKRVYPDIQNGWANFAIAIVFLLLWFPYLMLELFIIGVYISIFVFLLVRTQKRFISRMGFPTETCSSSF
jgi:hypothetical protein